MKKRIMMVYIVLLIFVAMPVNADEISDLQENLNVKTAVIAEKENEINALEAQKEALKSDVLLFNEELSNIQIQIDELNAKLEVITSELDDAIAKENEKKEIFHKRLVVMYEKGDIAYIEALVGCNDIMELSKRSELIRQISEYDRKIFDDYAKAKNVVKSKSDELNEISEQYQKQKDDFDEKIHAASSEIDNIDERVKQYKTELKALNDEKTEIEKKIYKNTYAGRVFAEGEKYLGYPYVWGGSTPETSFDCSGFVCWTYTHSGVYNLPRTTAQQIYNQCKKISPSEAREGDLIFFTNTYQSSEPVTHIGIYAGNGKMLHCGDPIKYASIQTAYWQSHFYGYGRLVR